eukprot:1524113-Pyramimonas_sp.AAC.1
MPVWRACQDFFDWHTAFKKGSSAGMPSAEATTENARAVVLRTYSSMLSMSGRIAAIIVARPAACGGENQNHMPREISSPKRVESRESRSAAQSDRRGGGPERAGWSPFLWVAPLR